jgi:hypothetical protein
MFAVRPLPGLPAYGPRAQSFPRPDAFSEGFVVEFTADDGQTWVGNFAKFWDRGETSVHTTLGSRAVVVVAGGSGYLVDTETRRLIREIGFDIQHIWFNDDLEAMIVSNGLWFEAFDAKKVIWRSRRFSWDGIRKLEQSGEALTGEAFDPMTDSWLPFRLNLNTGHVQGGSYNGPDM